MATRAILKEGEKREGTRKEESERERERERAQRDRDRDDRKLTRERGGQVTDGGNERQRGGRGCE